MTLLHKRTILMYGRTGAGKTAQIGELAEHIFLTSGLKTRLYTADKGGLDTIRPHVDEGIIEAVELGTADPWLFLEKAVHGYIRDERGKWALDAARNAQIGCFAFESMRSLAEKLMLSMAEKAAAGINIGGGSNIAFKIAAEGETLQVSGSNMAHFGVAQARMTAAIWESQNLNAPFIVWTSSVSKDEDTTAAGKVLGPDVIGKALTTEVPRWFNLTFRLDVLPAGQGKPERHILYLGNHVDVGAGGAAGLGNIRLPLLADRPEKITIEPASIVEALNILDKSYNTARSKLRDRLDSLKAKG